MPSNESFMYVICAVVILFLLVIFLAAYVLRLQKRLDRCQPQLECNELMLDQLNTRLNSQELLVKQENERSAEAQREQQQVGRQLEHRIKVVQEQLKSHQQQIAQNHLQQPEDKLYSRAQKMVLLGADVNELMVECDLPKAEAEMLVALHNKKRV